MDDLESLEWKNGRLVLQKWWGRELLPIYVGISRSDRARYGWFKGDTRFISEVEQRLRLAPNCNYVYNNVDLNLYVAEHK